MVVFPPWSLISADAGCVWTTGFHQQPANNLRQEPSRHISTAGAVLTACCRYAEQTISEAHRPRAVKRSWITADTFPVIVLWPMTERRRMVHAQWVFGLPVSKAGCTDVLGVILTDGYLDRTGVCLNKVLPSHSSSLQNSWLHLSVVSVYTFWLGCLNSSADFILRAVHIHYSLAGWGSGGWKCKVFFLRTPLLPHPTLFCLFSPRKTINVACENLTTCKSALQNLSTWAEPECSSTQKAGHNFPSKIFSQGRKAIKLWLLVLKGLPHSLQVEFTYIKLQTSAIHRGKKSATSVFLFLFSLHHGRKPCLFLVARVWQKGAWRTYCSINQATFFLSHAAHSDGGHVHSGLCLRSVRMTNGPLNGRTSTGSSTWF